MGFGLMGAGAAVSGLMGGYQQGRKFSQDEERFEMEKEKFGLEKEAAGQRKRLVDEQIIGAGLLNKKAQREIRLGEEEDEDLKASMDIVKSTFAPKQAPAGITDPASTAAPSQVPVTMTTPDGIEVQVPQAGGIAPPPGAARVAAPQSGPSLNELQEMYNKLNSVGLRKILRTQGPAAAVQQALEMGKRFGDAKTDAAIHALSGFNGGNGDQVSAALTQAGLPMPDGTKYERREIEVIPGSGHKVTDVVAISPDGKSSTSLHQLMRSRMTPAEIMRQDTEVGKAVAEITHRAVAEKNLNDWRTKSLDIQQKSANDQANYHLESLRLRREELEGTRDARNDAAVARKDEAESRTSRNALGDIMRMNGISKETSQVDMDKLPPEMQTSVRSAMARSVTAHTIWEMNKKGAAISPTEAMEVSRRVALDTDPKANPNGPKDIKLEGGQAYIMWNDQKVFIPRPAQMATTPAQQQAKPVQQPQPARPGIAPPPAQAAASQLPPEVERYGAALDAARQRLTAANATVQRFGLRQRQQDPGAFEAAQQSLADARLELERAESAYQSAIPQDYRRAASR